MNILVVDDDLISLRMFQNALELNGFNCKPCKDGKEGVSEYLKNKYDIVITDYSMPQMDGLELLRKIREINRQAKVIVYSGNTGEDLLVKAIREGVYKFLRKPIDWEELAGMLNELSDNKKV